ncbi:MAG: hypothetical protein DWI04_06820, partial [Planctomycetota bacterium]
GLPSPGLPSPGLPSPGLPSPGLPSPSVGGFCSADSPEPSDESCFCSDCCPEGSAPLASRGSFPWEPFFGSPPGF